RSLLLLGSDLVEIDHVAAGFGQVFVHKFRFPARHHVIVGDDARSGFKIFLQIGAQNLVGIGSEVDGHDVGGAQVDLQQVSLDDSRIVRQAHLLNPVSGTFHQNLGNLDSHGLSVVALHSGDQDAAIAVKRYHAKAVGIEISEVLVKSTTDR